MLEGGIDRDTQDRVRRHIQLGADDPRERARRRLSSHEFAEEHANGSTLEVERLRHESLEERMRVASRVGQGDPQLGAVQRRRLRERNLGMLDARTRGHEVQLARPDNSMRPDAVAVLDLALEQPTHRLQARVRMRGYGHPARGRHEVGAVVVDEAPRADEAARSLRERAVHGHRTRAAERHLARLEDLDGRGRAAGGGRAR